MKGLRLQFIKKHNSSLLNLLSGIRYIWNHAKEIDVLNVYHLNLSSFFWLLTYKLRKPPGGIGYLKTDMDIKGLNRLFSIGPVGLIKRMTIHLSDIASVETTVLYKQLEKRFGEKIIYIPNGFYCKGEKPSHFGKQNIILTVGQLGTYPKATEKLLEAFAGAACPLAHSSNRWKLVLVGPIDKSFRPYISIFLKRHKDIANQIIFTGPISDKDKLNKIYAKAKIFCLPSRSESFGIVLLEAASNGDFLVTTNGVPAGRDIYNDGKFGFIVPVDDVRALSGALVRLMNSKADWEARACEIADSAWHDFRWEQIVARLYEKISISVESSKT
ncbi:MAG: glycosyltransferase family 4 protein [Lachnospiraceae bacterium]|nr:glycosyltransferase family 4 protein [Lachnospiraceae bacterium]